MTFTRSKIICTVGPATESINFLRKLHKAGMNVVRINMSHATHKSAKTIIDRIDKINQSDAARSSKIGILLDTQGPEIRTGDTSIPIELNVGDNVTLNYKR
jgi:pyruvate kinase